ncbi:MAG: calcium-binding protein [Cyanobacteria bacterium P01_A01_bin.83]
MMDIDSSRDETALIGEAIKLSGEFNVNNAFSLSLAHNNNAEEYLAVWDFSHVGGRTVTSQRFSATGSLIGESVDLSQSANINVDPAAAYNSIDDRYLISFRVQEDPLLPFNSAVGQLIEGDSELIGENFALNDGGFELSLLYNPEVNQYFQTGRDSNFNQIIAQQIDSAGNLITPGITLDLAETDDAPNGEVAFDSVNNQYFAIWRRQDPDLILQGRLIAADGNLISDVLAVSQPVSPEGVVPFSSMVTEFDPIKTQYLVAYNLFQEQQVRAQLVDADGTLIGQELLLNDGFSSNLVEVDFSETLGIYLLVGVRGDELYGQFLSSSGNLLDETFIIDDDSNNAIFDTDIIANDSLEEFVVGWTQASTDGVFAQRLKPANLFNIQSGTSARDFLRGNGEQDFIDGRDGNDWLFGDNGDDTLEGGLGADTLSGQNNDDHLIGDRGRDLLFGGDGEDFLDGGEEADLLFGGSNADLFLLREGDGRDRIFDYRDGQDSFVLAHGLTFEQLTITQGIGQSTISITDTSEELASIVGVNASTINMDDFLLQQDIL